MTFKQIVSCLPDNEQKLLFFENFLKLSLTQQILFVTANDLDITVSDDIYIIFSYQFTTIIQCK